MKSVLSTIRMLIAILAMGWLAACETTQLEPFAEFSGDTQVVRDYASFYRLGPQQAGGADRSLRTGERVMLHRKQFGYSRVQLDNGQIGYMANEDIQAAPPEPRQTPSRRSAPTRSSAPSDEAWTDDRFDDFSSLNPSLDILPEDVPLEPLPDLMPEPSDFFMPVPQPAPEPTPIMEGIPAPAPEAPGVSTST